jgi:zinc protease
VQYGASAAIDQHHSVAPIITPTRADGRPVSTPLLAPADTTTTAYDVGGVRVIQRRVTANDVVAANLYLLGGTRQATPETVGTETLLLELSERGTRAYPRDVLRAKMARLGSAIVVEPAQDWTMLGLRATTSGFDSTWAIFADRVMRPRLDSTEMEVVREQLASAARQRRESPDALLEALADSVAFAGHPYALPPAGTERSIAAITVGDLRRYQATQMVKSRMLLVVVGNVERPRLERLVRSTLATLPAGSYRWTLPDSLPARPAALAIEARSLPTNYLLGYYTGPAAGSGDYQALRIAAAALSGRLFTEIRSRRNLTYAVNAPFVDRAISAGGLYVTTVSPDTTLALMRTEIANLQRELVPAEGLERLVQQFITEYFLDNETNSDQATFLARAQLYRGDYRTAERFVDELHAVTPDDVRRVARLYMRNVSFAYIGDPQRLTKRYVQF